MIGAIDKPRPAIEVAGAPDVDRVIDLDSHEMVPPELREGIFGRTRLNDIIMSTVIESQLNRPDAAGEIAGDDAPITYDTVWKLKGASAPSAVDLTRRPEVLDVMGVERQLVYPTFGLAALLMAVDPTAREFFGIKDASIDCAQVGREAIAVHNRWAVETTRTSNQRVRPVGLILTDSVESMVQQAQAQIAAGIRALMIPASSPPAGTSPGDPALDPFWRICAEADVPVTLHLGSERGFISSPDWSANVEAFKPSFKSTMEFNIEPLACAMLHYAPETFVSAMILGGVFERHPTLRFGVIELSASWVGPMADRLDMWSETLFRSRFRESLGLRPSEYMARNLRVTPFYFEPVGAYFDRYPHLADVYCYSSDFPHFEGGQESKVLFAEALADQSPEVRDKFFYRNGALLVPS